MRHPLRIIVVISVLALSVLGTSCGSLPSPTSGTPCPGPEVTPEQARVLPTPLFASPYPSPESTPTVYPPLPKPTPIPTLKPTATLPPTMLPLPPAA
ncbi:MAG: hypothetical protein JXA37_11680, partial [Chloroflexia bacterium]|nr:hypothetical protein [Chloroflexia bacterium]